jgi:hypothetical protein
LILDAGYRETRPKLYALLIIKVDRLLEAGEREAAFDVLMRALQVLPDGTEAQRRLVSYTPTPMPTPVPVVMPQAQPPRGNTGAGTGSSSSTTTSRPASQPAPAPKPAPAPQPSGGGGGGGSYPGSNCPGGVCP